MVFVDVEASRRMDEALREVGMDAPVPDLIGIGQGVARDAAVEPHVIQFRRLRTQAGLNVTQALPVGQLGKRHTAILLGTLE